MPIEASITGTPLGVITGSVVNAEDGTIQGTIGAVAVGTISSTMAVPGPQGPAGSQGPQGEQGDPGPAGVGVPAGGTANQILVKVDGVDYNTAWVNNSASAVWGNITGTLSSQTDLQTALNLKAPLASPVFTGNPTAPTPTFGDNDTSLATTAFVQSALLGGTAVARNLEVEVRNQSGATIAAGSIVYISGATGNKPLITKAQANNDTNSAQTIGFTKTSIANNGTGFVIVRGELENIDTSALTEGVQLYLSPTTAGTWTTTKPSAPQHLVYVGIVIRSHPTLGTILVAVQNGYELDELHDVAALTPSNNDLLTYESATNLWKNKSFGTLGLLTSADLSGYATESWVTSQGYITSSALTPYLLSSTAASTYQTLAGMSDYLAKADNLSGLASASAARSNLGLGSIATQSASSVAITGGSITGTTFNGTFNSVAVASGTGITFLSDLSTQSTAYPGSSGFLLKSGNLSGLADVATARSNLGLGTAATFADTAFLKTANNLSDVTASTARTNLGLGTAAVEPATKLVPAGGTTGQVLAKSSATDWDDAWITLPSAPVTSVAGKTGAVTLVVGDVSGAAPTASPALSGTPTAPTATAGTNTTQIATTAFVTAAVPALATFTTPTPTSTTTAVSPRVAMDYLMHPGRVDMYGGGYGVTSGAGAGVNVGAGTHRTHEIIGPNVGVAGNAGYFFDETFNGYGMYGFTRGAGLIARAWNKAIWASGRAYIGAASVNTYNGDANSTIRISVGGKSSTAGGDITAANPGFGWKIPGMGNAMQLQVSNGSTVTTVTSSFTPVARQIFDWKTYSDGAGNVTLWINDTQVATTTGGPSQSTPEDYNFYFEQVEQTSAAATRIAFYSLNPRVWWGV